MKHIHTFESFINESSTNPNIQALENLLGIIASIGIEAPEFVQTIKDNFNQAFKDLMKEASAKLSTAEQRKTLKTKIDKLLEPMNNAKTIKDLSVFVSNIEKDLDILKGINEAIDFKNTLQRVTTSLKKAGSKAKEWWDNNKYQLLALVVQFLLQLILEIVFALINGMLKTKINTPKVPKFGGFKGGDFGGGGAGGEW